MTGPKYTEFAQQAISLADLFQETFKKRIGGAVLYKIQLATPDGPSTGGGRQATQHITLEPEADAPKLVVGQADSAHSAAELRSFAFVSAQHASRFAGQLYPIEKEQYDDLVKRLRGFFELQQYQVTVTEPTQQMLDAALAAGTKKGLPVGMIVGGAIGLVAAGALAWLFLK